MDKSTALTLLRGGNEGVSLWNQSRDKGVSVPSLEGADLSRCDLSRADLRHVNLSHSDLFQANLSQARLDQADLSHAGLNEVKLYAASLCGTNLRDAHLRLANLNEADFTEADLRNAWLCYANLLSTCFANADLRECNLAGAVLAKTCLDNTLLAGAVFGDTLLSCDLSCASGLATTQHIGPSDISIRSLAQVVGKLPQSFLRGCGLSDEEISKWNGRRGVGDVGNRCFILHSSAESEFAQRIHLQLQSEGVRCWRWSLEATNHGGLWELVDREVQNEAKLIVIASESSLSRQRIKRRIKLAITAEAEQCGNDLAVLDCCSNAPILVQTDNAIGDFLNLMPDCGPLQQQVINAQRWREDPSVGDEAIRQLSQRIHCNT